VAASVGKSRYRSEKERPRVLRATTTAADPKRDCASSRPIKRRDPPRAERAIEQSASSGPRKMSVGPSKYELQGPTS
jgi:hypothetical protein